MASKTPIGNTRLRDLIGLGILLVVSIILLLVAGVWVR